MEHYYAKLLFLAINDNCDLLWVKCLMKEFEDALDKNSSILFDQALRLELHCTLQRTLAILGLLNTCLRKGLI